MSARIRSRRRTRLSPIGRIGLVVLGALVVVALAAPLLGPFDVTSRTGTPFARPSGGHLLGTNDIGQDLFTEVIYGARVSLTVGFAAAAVATIVGTAVGLVAGYTGGWVDALLMRTVDVVLTLPFLPLAIVVGVFLGPGLITLVGLIGAVTWAGTARELRAQVLSVRELDHVAAVQAMGAGTIHVLRRHILAAVAPVVVPQFVMAAKVAILAEASLSFLGLGDPTRPSWGGTLSAAHARSAFLTDAWLWWVVPPGLLIGLTVVAFALVGYGVEEAARPRLRKGAKAPGAEEVKPFGAEPTTGSAGDLAGSVLTIADLRVGYGGAGTMAVDGVSLSIQPGEVVGLIGESGSGKSTLVAAATGLLRSPAVVAGGKVFFEGADLADLTPEALRKLRGTGVALIPQEAMSALNPVLRVGAQVAQAVRSHQAVTRVQALERALEILGLVGIPSERARDYPHQFSGGMRQRVVIGMALVNAPTLLIADEPTTGLDLVTAAEVLDLLAGLQRQLGMAMLIVSHDLPSVLGVASRIVVMAAGRVVEVGTSAKVSSDPAHPHTRELLNAVPKLRNSALVGNSARVVS